MSDLPTSPSWCSICSEEITGAPLVEFTADWFPVGPEAQTVCSPDCFEQLVTQWREFIATMDDLRPQ